MKKHLAILLSILLCCQLLSGCGEANISTTNTRTITDSAGRQVQVPETVKSVVCVGVGALRYTCYMGAQDLVVGVEDYEVKPGMSRLYNYVHFDKFKDLPVIGTNGQPYTEEIVKLAPDVIVMPPFNCTICNSTVILYIQKIILSIDFHKKSIAKFRDAFQNTS